MKSSTTFNQHSKAKDNYNIFVNKFPSIIFTQSSRALMSLSKKQQLDGFNEFLSTHLSKEIKTNPDQFSLLRGTHFTDNSIKRFKQTSKSLTKIGKTLNFVKKIQQQKTKPSPTLSKLSSQLKTNKYYQTDKEYVPKKMFIKQQNSQHFNGEVKFCDRKFGCIESYVISSHAGSTYLGNQTRICVATNILQSFNKAKQISFFGLFQGRNGLNRAEYMRQNFHTTLINDELFYYNFEKAVSRTFEKLQKDFNFDPRNDGDYSTVSSIMSIFIGSKMFVIRQGPPNATISMNLGAYIKSLSLQTKQIVSHKYSLSSLSTYNTKLIIPKQNIHIRMFEINTNYDFIILGNEGLYQTLNNNNKNQLGINLWKYMLDQSLVINSKNIINNKLAKVCSKICEDAAKSDPLGRSMSMIVLQFNKMSECFEEISQLKLPFVNDKTQ